ncbi:hypothetical protein BKA60DRAFT_527185 [Fusarium oxysporum]|nr:hypothetical protein BKA60DRAFT_527185 [Fusarium oxysporum]
MLHMLGVKSPVPKDSRKQYRRSFRGFRVDLELHRDHISALNSHSNQRRSPIQTAVMFSPLVTRRNGKKQACEPCRRRKVACDHGYPVCRRCRKRPNGASACYYASPEQAATPSRSRLSQQPVSEASALNSEAAVPSAQTRNFEPDDGLWSSPAARPPQGFFGPTSFPAAYQETEASLAAQGPLAAEANAPPSPSVSAPPSVAELQSMTLREDQDDPAAWIESLSGPNLRWETVGVMFLYTALSELSTTSNEESKRIIRHCTEYCASCITLANMGGSSGTLMLFLMYKRSVLHAWMHGETSLPYWKFHAETVAMLTFSGLHDNRSKSSQNVSSVPTEIRRRIGCQIFIVDKFLATFVGRPPLLTRKFCSIKSPLDLEESALLSDKETSQRQSRRLDRDGWNTDGRIYSSSLLRVRMMIALVRDEILEVVLAQDTHSSITDIMTLKEKQLELYRQLPHHFLWDTAQEEIREINLEIGYPKLLIRLDHLLNMFLLQRLFVKHGHPRNELLRTSFEMVVLTLNFWAQKHIWAALQGKCRWIIMGYATLAGAVLCMELIEPVPVTISPQDSIIAGETYSRSSIIQQLSLLLGYLKTSCPSQTHCSVAHNVRGVIKKVLDHILNNQTVTQPVVEFGGLEFGGNWDYFSSFSALDNFDWLMEERGIEETSGMQ